jgi:hypothetical protein
MSKSVLGTCALWALLSPPALSQLEVTVDTLTIVESTTITYDGQLVDYFVLAFDEAGIMFIEDSAYVKMIGFVDGLDTAWLPAATVWMKTSGPQVGDVWEGLLPFETIIPTQEEIVGTKTVTVGAGTFPVFEIGVWDMQGVYLGEKWYSDGVGLLGWTLQICNETNNLQALELDLSGTGFWPHDVGDTWIYDTRTNRLWIDAPTAVIVVDGSEGDWVAVPPAVQDSPGDDTSTVDGTDIREARVARSADTLYLLGTFWDGPPDTTFALVHDLVYTFRFDEDGMGNSWGYSIGFDPAPVSQWYVEGVNLPGAGARVAVGDAVEVAIPRANLGPFLQELPFFKFSVDSASFDVTCYTQVRMGQACPIVQTGDTEGSGHLSSADIIYLVNFVLKGGPTPVPCAATGDVNCNGHINTTDVVYLVNAIFKAGPLPCDACSLVPGTWSCPLPPRARRFSF